MRASWKIETTDGRAFFCDKEDLASVECMVAYLKSERVSITVTEPDGINKVHYEPIESIETELA